MTTGFIRFWSRVLVVALLLLHPSAHATEGIDLDALKQEMRNLAEPAVRAKVRLKFAGRDGAEQAERLDQGLVQLQASLGRLEEADYPLRMAIGKVDRLRRDMESKERELERIKQYYVAQEQRLQELGGALAREKAEHLSHFPADLNFTDEQTDLHAAYERIRADFNPRHEAYVKAVSRSNEEATRDVNQALLVWTKAQREFGEAEVKRDQLREAAHGLLQDYSAARETVVAGVNAAARISRPTGVPLTPFSGNGVPLTQADLPPRQRGPLQSGTNAMEQLGGVVAAGEIARDQPGAGGGKDPSQLRFDTPEGPAGQIPAVTAGEPAGVAIDGPAVAQRPAAPPPPALQNNPKLKALATEREENARQMAEFRSLQREIASNPQKYEPAAMATVTENLSRVVNQDVTLRYMEETAKGGSETLDLEFTIKKPVKRPTPPVPK